MSSKTNTGKPYERLTSRVFRALLAQNAAENLSVEQDVDLRGITATHQIDVYWRFSLGLLTYETVVQCKDWATPVDQGELLKFKAVLDDLPGQPRGIVVARTGYQRGARQFASQHGIILYELSEPRDSDFEDSIRRINVALNLIGSYPAITGVEYDADWLAQERRKRGIALGTTFELTFGGDTMLLRSSGAPYRTVGEIIAHASAQVERMPGTHEIAHSFTDPVFCATGSEALPLVRLAKLFFTVNSTFNTRQFQFDLMDFVAVVLRDVAEARSAKAMFGRGSAVVVGGDPGAEGAG